MKITYKPQDPPQGGNSVEAILRQKYASSVPMSEKSTTKKIVYKSENKEKPKTEEFKSSNAYDIMIRDSFVKKGITDPEFIKLGIAIARNETDDYKSFVTTYNIGGLLHKYDKNAGLATWYKFNTIEEGVDFFTTTLKNRYDKGLTTPEQIAEGKKNPTDEKRLIGGYAPNTGADAATTNPHWITTTKAKMKLYDEGNFLTDKRTLEEINALAGVDKQNVKPIVNSAYKSTGQTNTENEQQSTQKEDRSDINARLDMMIVGKILQ